MFLVHAPVPPSISSRLYYKIIMAIVSDNYKWILHFKIIMMFVSSLPFALASVDNYDHEWWHNL
jgi:hypothetical protein